MQGYRFLAEKCPCGLDLTDKVATVAWLRGDGTPMGNCPQCDRNYPVDAPDLKPPPKTELESEVEAEPEPVPQPPARAKRSRKEEPEPAAEVEPEPAEPEEPTTE